jgi:predicted enzyme related to lactoylglutathione lyase
VTNVQDIDSIITKIEEIGGEIVFPLTVINGVGYLAYFRDLEGNVFGLMQEDPDACAEDGM